MTTICHSPIIPGYQIREQLYAGSRTKVYQLIDSSIASLLTKETQEIKNPNLLEGTLAIVF